MLRVEHFTALLHSFWFFIFFFTPFSLYFLGLPGRWLWLPCFGLSVQQSLTFSCESLYSSSFATKRLLWVRLRVVFTYGYKPKYQRAVRYMAFHPNNIRKLLPKDIFSYWVCHITHEYHMEGALNSCGKHLFFPPTHTITVQDVHCPFLNLYIFLFSLM